MPLDQDAELMAIEASNKFENLMNIGEEFFELKDRASKALENACRIAGILAVIDEGMATNSISAKYLERGLILVEWYLSEALRIRGESVVTQVVIDAESLSKWLQERQMKVFRTTQVLTSGPNQLRNKSRLMGAISELVNNGYLAQNESGAMVDKVKPKLSWMVLHYVV